MARPRRVAGTAKHPITERDLQLPQRFGYTGTELWSGLAVMAAACLALPVMFFGWGLEKFVRSTREVWSVAPWPAVTCGAFSVTLFLGYPLLILALAARCATDAWRRRDESVEVADAGLAFELGDSRFEVPWREVVRVVPAAGSADWEVPARCQVVTHRGTFEFSTQIRRSWVLAWLIRQRAAGKSVPDATPAGTDALGGDTSCWSGGAPGLGQRIYCYRTSANRALLALAFGVSAAALLGLLLNQVGLAPPRDPAAGIWLAALGGTTAGWALWRYRAARIRTDDRGIYQDGVLGTRFILWAQVTRYYRSGEDVLRFGNVTGAGTWIWFWLGIADAAELRSEIARRASNARDSSWEPGASTRGKGRP